VTDNLITDRITMLQLSKLILKSVVDKDSKRRLKKFRKSRSRIKMLKKEFKESKSHLTHLCSAYLKYVYPITSPVALISQIQRSGGSLLAQLFDSHPEVHAHPYELTIGKPKKYIWPKIDIKDNPERWIEILFEDIVIKHFREGYKKGPKADETFSFFFLPPLQKKIFLHYINSFSSITLRDIYDAYMTSYFGAWLNYQNHYGDKKFVTAFTPRLAIVENSIESFFQIYPDGRLISIVRDPKNWYPSALKHKAQKKKYGDIRIALNLWIKNTQAMLRNKEKYGERVCIIKFEDLITKTESVMRYLAEFLDIQFHEVLLTPTFNQIPIRANTSFEAKQHGIMNSTLSRYKTLSEEDLNIIDTLTSNEYEMVLAQAATL
jgi:hypothetical protein